MNVFMTVLGFLLIAVGISIQVGGRIFEDREISHFAMSCQKKGGITLRGYSPDGNGWTGCYSGLTEIPNEKWSQ